MIYINRLEEKIESGLGPRSRLALRVLVTLLTHAVMAMMVLAATRVVEILMDSVFLDRDVKIFGVLPFAYIIDSFAFLDWLIVTLFAISAITIMIRESIESNN